jgi:branched-chain amino acid aminotransferase
MATTLVFINDAKVTGRQASISVFDYTLHCGIGLFESILAVDDRLIMLDEHLDRMERGIRQLHLSALPYRRDRLAGILRRAASEHPARVKKIKLLLTQGYSPLWPGDRPQPKAITIVTDHRLQFKKQKLLVSPMTIHTSDLMRGNKTLNFMTEWLSQEEAKRAGFDQGIIINQHGRIAETGSANLFAVRKGVLSTPALTAGGLPGTIRNEIIRLARVNHIPFREAALTPRDLIAAEEVFITSSFKLVWPVVLVRIDRDYAFQPGPLSKAIFDRLKSNFMTGRQVDSL